MLNYLKSENYRLLHKKSLYIMSFIFFLLLAAAAFVLYFMPKLDSTFPYGTSKFYYANVVSSGTMIIIVGLLFNLILAGKDTALVKQSISFGISRNVIFWSKLVLTLGYFLLVCLVGIVFVLVLGESLLITDSESVKNFIIASINMIPLVLSGFFLIHTMKMLKIGDVFIIITLFFIYKFSGYLLLVLFRPIEGLKDLYRYAPNSLFDQNLMNYMDDMAQLGYEYWIVGIIISCIALFIGAKGFTKKDIN